MPLNIKSSSVADQIMKNRDLTPETPQDETESSDDSGIETCAYALISAIQSQDPKAVAEALKDAFAILESLPHEEGPHIQPHSYEAQNIKAGE